MIDEINFDSCSSHYWEQGSSAPPEETAPPLLMKPVDEAVSSLRSSHRILRGSLFSIDLSTARTQSDIKAAQTAPTPIKPLDEKVTLSSTRIIEAANEKTKTHSEKTQKHKYTMQMQTKGGEVGQYVLGVGEMALGAGLMVTGAAIEVGSLGTLTVAVGFQEAAGFALLTDGFARTMRDAQDISIPKLPKYDPLLDIVNKPKEKPRKWDEPGSPPIRGDELVGDGTTSPQPGFDDWNGTGGPSSGKGSWYNPSTGQSLHPDLNHPPPENPHWDYKGPDYPKGAKLYPDGTWVPK